MIRVQFLKAKRYPHPDGPKRPVGVVLDIQDEWAERWSRVGIVKKIEGEPLADKTVSELRAMASEAGVDVPTNARKADLIHALS